MSEAPERIWADGQDYWANPTFKDDKTEYIRADRIEELEAKVGRLRNHLQWIHDGAHTRGHTLPDIKERAGIALDGGEDRG